MTVEGYMVEAEWDGNVLVARGTSGAGRVALLGQDHKQGEVSIPRAEMAGVEFKDASRMVNGRLVVSTVEGREYQLHFRRKQAEGFRQLAEELGAR